MLAVHQWTHWHQLWPARRRVMPRLPPKSLHLQPHVRMLPSSGNDHLKSLQLASSITPAPQQTPTQDPQRWHVTALHVGMTARCCVMCAEGGTAQQAVGVAAARAFTSSPTQAQAVARALAAAIALYGCPAIQPIISSAPFLLP